MKIPYFEAIDKDTGDKVRGFYFEYPYTTYCFTEDYASHPAELVPCLVFSRMSDWGLPNHPMLCQNIDKSTLKQIGWVDTDKDFYKPKNWIEFIENESVENSDKQ